MTRLPGHLYFCVPVSISACMRAFLYLQAVPVCMSRCAIACDHVHVAPGMIPSLGHAGMVSVVCRDKLGIKRPIGDQTFTLRLYNATGDVRAPADSDLGPQPEADGSYTVSYTLNKVRLCATGSHFQRHCAYSLAMSTYFAAQVTWAFCIWASMQKR